jgi:hypothetical protein
VLRGATALGFLVCRYTVKTAGPAQSRGELTGGISPRELLIKPPANRELAALSRPNNGSRGAFDFTASKYGPRLLVADRELNQNALISLRAAVFDIRQQSAALRYKAQQAPPRRMIFFVCLKVFGQLSDTRAQNCDLHFRRPGVGLVGLVPGYDLPFCFSRQCHLKGCYSCSSLYSICINASVTQSGAVRGCLTSRSPSRYLPRRFVCIRCGSQVVRPGSAKPLFVGSIPTRTSNKRRH